MSPVHFTDDILRQIIRETEPGSILSRLAAELLAEREDRVIRKQIRLGYRTEADADGDGVPDPSPDHGWRKRG